MCYGICRLCRGGGEGGLDCLGEHLASLLSLNRTLVVAHQNVVKNYWTVDPKLLTTDYYPAKIKFHQLVHYNNSSETHTHRTT